MTAKPVKTTLDDIAKSIDSMQTQMGSMQVQIDSMQAQMVTKDEFNASISRLEATIRREAGDLGESVASLTNMVNKEFDSLTITRLKPARHIKTARPRAAERD